MLALFNPQGPEPTRLPLGLLHLGPLVRFYWSTPLYLIASLAISQHAEGRE
mgnify:FL=1